MVYPLNQLPAVGPAEARGMTFSDQRYDPQRISRPPLAHPRIRCPEIWTSAANREGPEAITLPPFQTVNRQFECTQCTSPGKASFTERCIACFRRIWVCVFWRCAGRTEKNPPSVRSSINADDIIELEPNLQVEEKVDQYI